MAIGEQVARPGEGPGLRQHNAQKEAEGLETSAKVWELKKAGMSFRTIAKQLQMSPSGVHEAYKRVIRTFKDQLLEDADDFIHLHMARLEDVVAFQTRVMKGMDVRPPAIINAERKAAEERGDDPGELEPPLHSLPTIEERLKAANDVVKTGESFRKLMGIDAPEKSEVDVKGVVGTIDLTELAGSELLAEADALGAGLRTMGAEKVKELVAGKDGTLRPEDDEASRISESPSAQPQEV